MFCNKAWKIWGGEVVMEERERWWWGGEVGDGGREVMIRDDR